MARPRKISDDEILEAVRAEVRASGAHFSLRTVAERLGVSQPALFQRFGTRKRLLESALMPSVYLEVLRPLDAGPDERPLEAQLIDALQVVARFFADALPVLIAWREAGLCDSLGECFGVTRPRKLTESLAGWLERAHARGLTTPVPPESTAFALTCAVSGYVMLEHVLRGPAVAGGLDAHLTNLARLFAQALGPAGRMA